MARKARVYHRRPVRTKHGQSSTDCIVSYDGGETFEAFKNAKPRAAEDNHKIVITDDGEVVIIEKKLR